MNIPSMLYAELGPHLKLFSKIALNIVNKSHGISREDHVFISTYAQVRCVRLDIGGQPLSVVLSGIIW